MRGILKDLAEVRARQSEAEEFRLQVNGHVIGRDHRVTFSPTALAYYNKWFRKFGIQAYSGMTRDEFRFAINVVQDHLRRKAYRQGKHPSSTNRTASASLARLEASMAAAKKEKDAGSQRSTVVPLHPQPSLLK